VFFLIFVSKMCSLNPKVNFRLIVIVNKVLQRIMGLNRKERTYKTERGSLNTVPLKCMGRRGIRRRKQLQNANRPTLLEKDK
jgi:hypothetical protein